jgi:type II secretory pathway pseudopilin PulG
MTKARRQKGFTLIELMIIVFVMAMVGGALIVNFRQGEKQRRVNLMRDMVISALRSAQNYTLSGRQIPPPGQATHVRGPARCVNDNAALSYWVEFTTATAFDIMAQDRCGAVIRMETFAAVAQTQFAGSTPYRLTTSLGSADSGSMAVRFTPPFGSMTAATTSGPVPGSFASFVGATITVEFQDGERQRTVNVDGISGRID